MQHLGKGSTGTVFTPPLECGTCKSDNTHVGKMFAHEYDYNNELEIHENIISVIDPDGEFAPPLLGQCFIPPLMQLCFAYGGETLSKDIFRPFMMKEPSLSVYKGISILAKYGYSHSDIKTSNLTYNKNTGKLMLIDYNLLGLFKNTYHPENQYIRDETRLNAPPEFMIAKYLKYDKKSVTPSGKTYMNILGNHIAFMAQQCHMQDLLSPEFLERDYLDMTYKYKFSQIKKESYSKIDVYMLGITFLYLLYKRREAPPADMQDILVQMIRPNVFKRINPHFLYEQVRQMI